MYTLFVYMNDMDIFQVAYTHAKHRHDTNKKDFQCNYLFLLKFDPFHEHIGKET